MFFIFAVSNVQQHLHCCESGSSSVEREIQWSLGVRNIRPCVWFQQIGMRPQWLVSWLPLSSCTCTGHFRSLQPLSFISEIDCFCALWNETSSTISVYFVPAKTFCTLLEVNVRAVLRLFQELTSSSRKCSSLPAVRCLLLHALQGKNGNNAENIRHDCTKCSQLINCAPMLCAPLV